MPEMTGDTANGRSISVVSRFLPRKSNLAMAQPAQTPNTRFNGTAIAAASSVSFSAAIASGCVIASVYAPHPCENASEKTSVSGRTRKSARNASTTAVSVQRSQTGSDR